jgi:asparagine synthase (glutamine-hydrolysing)
VREGEGFPWARNLQQRLQLRSESLREKLPNGDFAMDAYRQTCRESDILPENTPLEKRMKEMVNLNFTWFMQTLLDRKDRMSMATSLEVRVPFCDYRIAEYMYAVPWEWKDYRGVEKGLLRKAMEGVLPDEILWRKKSPYPKTYHPQYTSMIRRRAEELMEDSNARIFAIVDRKAFGDLLAQEFTSPWYGQLMGGPQTYAYFLQMEHWLRHYDVSLTW